MSTNDDRETYFEASARMNDVARRLMAILDPVDVAGVLMGAGVNALVSTIGKDGAVSYLRDLATELENDPQSKPN